MEGERKGHKVNNTVGTVCYKHRMLQEGAERQHSEPDRLREAVELQERSESEQCHKV